MYLVHFQLIKPLTTGCSSRSESSSCTIIEVYTDIILKISLLLFYTIPSKILISSLFMLVTLRMKNSILQQLNSKYVSVQYTVIGITIITIRLQCSRPIKNYRDIYNQYRTL